MSLLAYGKQRECLSARQEDGSSCGPFVLLVSVLQLHPHVFTVFHGIITTPHTHSFT